MEKWIIGLLLFLICSLMGYRVAYRMAQRSRQLELIGRILHGIRTEIRYGNTALPEIFQGYGRQLSSSGGSRDQVGGLWLEYLGQSLFCGISLEEAWPQSLKTCFGNGILKKEDLELLEPLGFCLGHTDKDSQLEILMHYGVLVEEQQQKAKAEGDSQGRLSKSLGVLGGAFLLVLIF